VSVAREVDPHDHAPPLWFPRETVADAEELTGRAAATATTTLASSDAAPQSMGDVDLDVFLALPAEIQEELRRTLGGSGERAQVSAGVSAVSRSATSVLGGAKAPQGSKRKIDALSTGSKSGKSGSGHTQGKQLGILDMWKRSK
jgi:hypothetical protein